MLNVLFEKNIKIFLKKVLTSQNHYAILRYVLRQRPKKHEMREWLSGGAPPCQGGGRGFDPRLALFLFYKYNKR